ncbi:hypothetical protein D3C75_224560 [compost metagenome]
MNQLAHAFGDELPDDVNDKLYDVVSTKMSYEAEIQKVLGDESEMLARHRLLTLAEEITLEELYNVDHGGIDEICCYISRFPEEKAKWLNHLMTFI